MTPGSWMTAGARRLLAAHQTAESLRQSNLAIEQLNGASRGLQTSVARFKLNHDSKAEKLTSDAN